MIKSSSVRLGRSAAITVLLVAIAGIEIWALSTPVLRDLRVGILGERSARDVAVVLDVLLVLPGLLFGDRLRLVRGLRSEAVLRLADVEVIEVGEAEAGVTSGPEPRFVFRLRQPVRVYGWFGALREVQ